MLVMVVALPVAVTVCYIIDRMEKEKRQMMVSYQPMVLFATVVLIQ
jgi:hypothetical protein